LVAAHDGSNGRCRRTAALQRAETELAMNRLATAPPVAARTAAASDWPAGPPPRWWGLPLMAALRADYLGFTHGL
jgi:hypothetical protein